MNYRAGYRHQGQSPGNHTDTCLFQHFSYGTVCRVLAGFDNAGDGGPGQVIGALDQQNLLIADDDSGRTRQPQGQLSDVPTKLDDEFGDRHTQLFNRDRELALFRGGKTFVSCSAMF